jgi:hypothetical protein
MNNYLLSDSRQEQLMAEIKQGVLRDEQMRIYALGCDDREYHAIRTSPHILYGASIKIDGDMYCCLLGENLQEGVAGFGKMPKEACEAFDKEWKGIT